MMLKMKAVEMLPIFQLLAIFAFNIKGICSTCLPPTDADLDDFDNIRLVSTAQTEYVISDKVVYGCDSGNGYGYFTLTCQSADGGSVWADRSRDCKDNYPVDGGSLAGILFGVFTLLVCIVLIILSTRMKKKHDEQEALELKEMQKEEATKA